MPQEREAPEAVIQGRLLKIIQAAKRLTPTAAQWCVDHAVDKDLLKVSAEITSIAKQPAK